MDLNQLAKFAIDMIVERIEDGDSTPPSRATIGWQLVKRESTANSLELD